MMNTLTKVIGVLSFAFAITGGQDYPQIEFENVAYETSSASDDNERTTQSVEYNQIISTTNYETEHNLIHTSQIDDQCFGVDKFRCDSGECITSSKVCNGDNDCIFGEDEEFDCGESITLIFALISMVCGSLFALLFIHMYYIRISMLDEAFAYGAEDLVCEYYTRYIFLVESAVKMTLKERT